MHQTTALPTNHADLVTDVVYDYYGERLATTSADQKIKVWKKDPVKGSWDLEDEWKAHDAPILQLAWSHPEHSSLLASCSYDRSVRIWEQVTVPYGGRPGAHTTTPGKRWIECGLLMDARGSVRNIEFAPNAFGLKIATISTDSYLRIYTCLSPSLDDWQLTNTVSLPSLQTAKSTDDQPLIGLGVTTGTGSTGSALTGSTSQSSGLGAPNPGKGNEALAGWCLSWCKERWWGQVLAATSGHSGIIKVRFRALELILVTLSTTTPTALLVLHPPPTTTSNSITSSTGTPNSSTAAQGLGAQAITSLSWAPSCGRSYHLLASGHRDGTVRIWKVLPPPAAGEQQGEEQRGKAWRAEVAAEWGKGDVTVGKVEWNMTGSILSVASEDGKVRLFKATYAGDWQLYGTFSAEAPDEAPHGEGEGRMQE
ncbi:hypothetical protein QFC20_007088 [Naganishia adeliensis]|uniref:Uncharacterized protein n=1 Tax=Naganishia adeliensis TaxID=92952 RepID=A0ACC2V3S7_9TREE|nr:hypothetical protein QFC20_007088 [Naganishia adeliensis]